MNEEIINKLDEITEIIENDKENLKLSNLKKRIEQNKELYNQIIKVKEIDNYSSEYISLKEKILKNKDYKSYKEIENDLYFITKQMTKILNTLKEKSDFCENNKW